MTKETIFTICVVTLMIVGIGIVFYLTIRDTWFIEQTVEGTIVSINHDSSFWRDEWIIQLDNGYVLRVDNDRIRTPLQIGAKYRFELNHSGETRHIEKLSD